MAESNLTRGWYLRGVLSMIPRLTFAPSVDRGQPLPLTRMQFLATKCDMLTRPE